MFVVDTDAGYDDLLAILYLLASTKIDAITVVNGLCSDPAVGASIIRSMVEQAGHPEVPVYIGATAPLAGGHASPPEWQNQILHLNWPAPKAPPQPGAVQVLQKCFQSGGSVLAVGPMTNLALALQGLSTPAAASVLMMGGALGVAGQPPAGNMGTLAPNSEFHMYIDPAAAQAVLGTSPFSRLPGLVPLNATNTVPITIDFINQFAQLPTTPLTTLTNQVFQGTYNDNREMFDSDQYFAWDPLAAVGSSAITSPENAALTLDLLGAISVQPNQRPTAQVYMSADAAAFQSLFFSAFKP
jgi:inosine-uridine nucleoside N-ribohydrolase